MGPYGAHHASANIVRSLAKSTFLDIAIHMEKVPTNYFCIRRLLRESIGQSQNEGEVVVILVGFSD